MLFVFQLALIFAEALKCNKVLCPEGSGSNLKYDINCMNLPCNFDTKYAGYDSKFQIRLSPCLWKCLEFCSMELLMNDVCDSQCNRQECGYDRSMCGYCADGCFENMIGNGICDQMCDNEQCHYDSYECGTCAQGCFDSMIGDGKCDESCYNFICGWDSQDCYHKMCSPSCNPDMKGNSVCNQECNVAQCDYDDGIATVTLKDYVALS